MKKVLALSLVAVMALVLCSTAFAASGALSVNGTLQVSGLDAGDKVAYYQILKWQEDAEGVVGGWIWGDDIKTSGSTLTDTDLAMITGTTDGSGRITAAMAGKIAANLSSTKSGTAITGTTWTKTVTDAGLYMVIVEAAKAGTMYNPIFVAANWYGAAEGPDSSNSIAVSADVLTYSDSGAAKKSTIPLDKTAKGTDGSQTADDGYKTDVGEVVDFTVTTKIPKFADNFVDPVFKLVDKLEGLALTGEPVVKAGTTTLNKGSDYELTNGAAGDTTYTIKFKKGYLQNVGASGQDITVTYSAKVTDKALQVVNQDKNTVDLIFSTKPEDTTGYGLLRDKTNHFTFSIDANLIGWTGVQESSTEAIKVGVDKEGNVIVESKSYFGDPQWTHGALEGATFKLYKDSACTQLYANPEFTGTVLSDGTGRITIKGLDVGTYYLKETDAPQGYIKMQDVVPITIAATVVEDVEITEEVDDYGITTTVTYKTNRLTDYSITIGGTNGKTTTYTIENSGDLVTKTTSSTVNVNGGHDYELKNTKGVELPSTGGIGTTIFYVTGLLMVLGAATVLVARRKADAE